MKKHSLSFILLFLVSSCASSSYKVLEKEYKEGDISLNAIKNLAHASYLKGCTEHSKLSFKKCKQFAKEHVDDITDILK